MTFAEFITGMIDINHMERIALRIKAIQADLMGVFLLFLEHDQPESESYSPTVRVFRGVPVTGEHAFTKDAV